MHERAGTTATPSDLIDVNALLAAYTELVPDVSIAEQRVAFGTSGHRGSSLDCAFNETHILAITQAIVEYRAAQGITGPLFLGGDTHALSAPAIATALEVLRGNGVWVLLDSRDSWVPTPALSHAILRWNRTPELRRQGEADGIVVTPSHNPPRDGGFKYNPPHGGPADTDATAWIANRANELIADGLAGVHRSPSLDFASLRSGTAEVRSPSGAVPERSRGVEGPARGTIDTYDFREHYVADLDTIIDLPAIAASGIRIGADPLGGASVDYWALIGERYGLNLTVLNETVDPTWQFMTLDWDGTIRMDPSSANAMASVLRHQHDFDVVTGNDADADRHGIVTPDGGLMNPNHFLAVAIEYLYTHRSGWSADAAVGKTMVSSSMIDRVAGGLGRELLEVPVGFKWFVPGLLDGSVPFGGEESAGASFARFDGSAWTTDKDGILLCLLAAEIRAVTGRSPSELYRDLTEEYGDPAYARVDAPATPAQKAALGKLDGAAITATELAGEPILAKLSAAPGNGAALGGVKVVTEHAWFAARPSGTENVYKIYAESFLGPEHLAQVQAEAKRIVDAALGSA
ncbi:MAG: phosphoglucomutase, alpha-D-glucose phosphate-specific [Microbacteriaceae bacterium]